MEICFKEKTKPKMNYGWIGKTIFKKSTPNQQTENKR